MPIMESIRFPCMLSVNARITGTPPTQLASKYSPALPSIAAAFRSSIHFANISLLAVTMDLPAFKEAIRKERAGSIPPKNSATTLISGSEMTSLISVDNKDGSMPKASALVRSRSMMRRISMSTPSEALISSLIEVNIL